MFNTNKTCNYMYCLHGFFNVFALWSSKPVSAIVVLLYGLWEFALYANLGMPDLISAI